MVSQNDRIGLVTPPGREEEALERLGRIGYTNVSAPTSHLIQSTVQSICVRLCVCCKEEWRSGDSLDTQHIPSQS